jgi:hypothetical protein
LLVIWWMLLAFSITRNFKGEREREGGNGRYLTPENMSKLMPAEKSRCWRQNLKATALRAHTLLQDLEQWRCTCAHPERGEAEGKERHRFR